MLQALLRNVRAMKLLWNLLIVSQFKMPILRVICWALIFITRLRFPPADSIADILKRLFSLGLSRRPQPAEQGYSCARSCWEIWHKMSGRLTILASVINITLGLFLAVAPTIVWALWLGYVGLWIVIFIAAEIVKRPFEKDLRRKAKKPAIYDTGNPYRITKGQVNTAF